MNRWHRVAVSVKCASDAKQKGELLTWVDAVGGAVVKSEAISANGRFALDPAALYLFSSAQSAMMSRTVAIRTVRVVASLRMTPGPSRISLAIAWCRCSTSSESERLTRKGADCRWRRSLRNRAR
jgi:hypothetical protein